MSRAGEQQQGTRRLVLAGGAVVLLCALYLFWDQGLLVSSGLLSATSSRGQYEQVVVLPESNATAATSAAGTHAGHGDAISGATPAAAAAGATPAAGDTAGGGGGSSPGGVYRARPGKAVPLRARRPVALNGTFKLEDGVEVVYQVPPEPPLGVWFLAHGCSHSGLDFWPKHPGSCDACTGLPEEMNVTSELLARGYAVVAMSSLDRGDSRCWFPTSPLETRHESADVHVIKEVLTGLLATLGLDKLPLYAFGASSGGAYALYLALGNLRLAGVCSQIMAVEPELLQKYITTSKKQANQTAAEREAEAAWAPDGKVLPLHPLPPVMFVHMPRDTHTAMRVKENLAVLQAEGVPSKEVEVHPAPLTPTLLHEAAPAEISEEQSRAIYQALKEAGYLSDPEGLLLKNPRASDWRQTLQHAKVPGFEALRLQPDLSPVSEVLNVLFAGHEIVSRTTTQMVDWFESWEPVKV